jgi:hypothetical protein
MRGAYRKQSIAPATYLQPMTPPFNDGHIEQFLPVQHWSAVNSLVACWLPRKHAAH